MFKTILPLLTLSFLALLLQPQLPAASADEDGQGVASFWWSPGDGSVSSGYAGSLEEARGIARHRCGHGDCEEVRYETSQGVTGMASYYGPDGTWHKVWGWGYDSYTDLLRDLDERAEEEGYSRRRAFTWERIR